MVQITYLMNTIKKTIHQIMLLMQQNNARMLLNDLRSNLSREETKRIRDKLYKKEAIYNFLKEKIV